MADIVKKSNEAYATGLPASIRLIGYKKPLAQCRGMGFEDLG